MKKLFKPTKVSDKAWAAWLKWCKEHIVNPKCSTTQKAFLAGWQAAIREVIKMQGEEADALDGEEMLEGAQASTLRKANASLKAQNEDKGFVQGMHECPKSPDGTCYYNEEEDPAWDFCIYCREPHERK